LFPNWYLELYYEERNMIQLVIYYNINKVH
jgi:hypothetical protein